MFILLEIYQRDWLYLPVSNVSALTAVFLNYISNEKPNSVGMCMCLHAYVYVCVHAHALLGSLGLNSMTWIQPCAFISGLFFGFCVPFLPHLSQILVLLCSTVSLSVACWTPLNISLFSLFNFTINWLSYMRCMLLGAGNPRQGFSV